MSLPPKNKWFTVKTKWYSFSEDGDSTKHGPELLVAIRYDKDSYAFIHKGQPYKYEKLYPEDIKNWELLYIEENKVKLPKLPSEDEWAVLSREEIQAYGQACYCKAVEDIVDELESNWDINLPAASANDQKARSTN